MPSTVVHLALAGVVGVALLGEEFTPRALAVVLAAAALIDSDAFVGLVLPGAHRSLFHTLLLPVVLGGLVAYDSRIRGGASFLRRRWGDHGVRVAWVAVAGLTFGGIFPDLFTNGVNAFYPLHDTFYRVNGRLLVSSQRGLVQTFVELAPETPRPTTETLHYSTAVDPTPGREPKNVERVFPVVMSGWQLMLVVVGGFVMGTRLWEFYRD
jgi:hypothetical protein